MPGAQDQDLSEEVDGMADLYELLMERVNDQRLNEKTFQEIIEDLLKERKNEPQ